VFLPVGGAYALGVAGLTPSTRLLALVGVLSIGLLAAAAAAAAAGRAEADRVDPAGRAP
jgi:predicted ATPase